MVPYTLVRSGRKTLALTLDREGRLVVRAPRRMGLRRIEGFIQEKEPWILRKQAEIQAFHPVPITGTPGEVLPFRGERLTLASGEGPRVERRGDVLYLPPGAGPETLADWLRGEALAALTENTARRAAELGLTYSGLKLTEARGRWGSCNARNVIRLSWRLVLCPPAAADYVAVHELCHVLHKDHSRSFWAAVEAACPDWRDQRRWLHEHRGMMELF